MKTTAKTLSKIFLFVLLAGILTACAACSCSQTPAGGERDIKWQGDFPVIDGSTSTIPMETALRAYLFDLPAEKARQEVNHTTTHNSFTRLINGECELVLSVPISDDQRAAAAAAGVSVEEIEIAREAFVFIVNADNPIESLTRQQIKDIYSGKITNWQTLGGNDEEIIAYQRNENSGSQNYMREFMADTPLMSPPSSIVLMSMGDIIDKVAGYENISNSIGYSVYTYAADMYTGDGRIKFLSVDGVEPSLDTMSEGSYPLLSYNYAYLNSESAKSSPARRLVDWMLTDEGQAALASGGYIPLRPTDTKITLQTLAYTKTGTGIQKPKDYAPSDQLITATLDQNRNEYLRYSYDPDAKKASVELLKYFLSDEITDFANEWLAAEIANISDQAEDFQNFLSQRNAEYRAANPPVDGEPEPAPPYTAITALYRDVDMIHSTYIPLVVRIETLDAYCSIYVGQEYSIADSGRYVYDAKTVVFDIRTGEVAENFSDLFFASSNFAQSINSKLNTLLIDYIWDPWYYSSADSDITLGSAQSALTADSFYLTSDYAGFTLNEIIYTPGNVFFSEGVLLTFDNTDENCVLNVNNNVRDYYFAGAVNLKTTGPHRGYSYDNGGLLVHKYYYDENDPSASVPIQIVKSDDKVSSEAAKKINAYMREYAAEIARKTPKQLYEESGSNLIELFLTWSANSMPDADLTHWKNTLTDTGNGDPLENILNGEHGGITQETYFSDTESAASHLGALTYEISDGGYLTFGRASVYMRTLIDVGPVQLMYLPYNLSFDPKTGEQVTTESLFRDGWEEDSAWYGRIDMETLTRKQVDPPKTDDLIISCLPNTVPETTYVADPENPYNYVTVDLPYITVTFMEKTGYGEYIAEIPLRYLKSYRP